MADETLVTGTLQIIPTVKGDKVTKAQTVLDQFEEYEIESNYFYHPEIMFLKGEFYRLDNEKISSPMVHEHKYGSISFSVITSSDDELEDIIKSELET